MTARRRWSVLLASVGLLVIITIAATGVAMTFPNGGAMTGELHCKDVAHLEVTVGTYGLTTNPATATHMERMPCSNAPGTPDGVVVSVGHNHPMSGLHLLVDAVAWLPGALRATAGQCGPGQTVTLSHTVDHDMKPFATFTPQSAVRLASAIEAAA